MEVVIAYSLLALLLVLAFSAIQASSRPVTAATVRSGLMSHGSLVLARLVQELEQAHTVRVGEWDGAIFVDDLTDEDPDAVAVLQHGRAVRFRVPDRAVPFSAGAVNLAANEVIWAFRAEETQNALDDDDDGHVDELRLVRVERDATTLAIVGIEVQMLLDVLNRSPGAVAPDPPGAARFQHRLPSMLRIEFALGKQIDFDTATSTRRYAEVEFSQAVNVRNMNQ
jgi:hypothetical protein